MKKYAELSMNYPLIIIKYNQNTPYLFFNVSLTQEQETTRRQEVEMQQEQAEMQVVIVVHQLVVRQVKMAPLMQTGLVQATTQEQVTGQTTEQAIRQTTGQVQTGKESVGQRQKNQNRFCQQF